MRHWHLSRIFQSRKMNHLNHMCFLQKIIIFLWNNIWAKPYCPWMKFIKCIKCNYLSNVMYGWKLLRILERTMWFKLYFTHLIWIYLKFCQNRRYKWKHTYFYKNWSIFSKLTVWAKPYCPWLIFFFQVLLDILGNATQFEPHVLLIKLVKFL